MTHRRPPRPGHPLPERVVGETQWVEGPGTTLRQATGKAFVWTAVGVVLFMLFLAGANLWLVDQPVRGWSFLGRTVGLVGLLILAWVPVARLLAKVWLRRGLPARLALSLLLVAAAVGSAFALSKTVPEAPSQGMLLEIGGRFAFGPYPTPELLGELAAEGFHGVITVLDPGGPSDEAGLLIREQSAAGRAGLELVSVPLFSSGAVDSRSLETLLDLARGEGRRYYVHGVTEDSRRLELVRRLLLRFGGRRPTLAGRIADGTAFERGPTYELDPEVHLTPHPTDAELLEYVIAGPVRTVVALLDPASPEDREWIEREEALLDQVGIAYRTAPLHAMPFEPEGVLATVELIRQQEHPVVVQAFLTPSVQADALRQAWTSGRPPLPPGVFEDSLSGGPVEVIAPHVAIGPRPVTREFGWLYRRGVRAAALVGEESSWQRREDRSLSDVAGLEWYFLGGDEERLLEQLEVGGPWYVYGPDVERVGARITERFGAPLPEREDPEAASEPEHQQE